MENLSKQNANDVIRGFGLNPNVSPVARAAIRSMHTGIVSRDPENCSITVVLTEEIDPSEILQHFPERMHENIAFSSTIEALNPTVE